MNLSFYVFVQLQIVYVCLFFVFLDFDFFLFIVLVDLFTCLKVSLKITLWLVWRVMY